VRHKAVVPSHAAPPQVKWTREEREAALAKAKRDAEAHRARTSRTPGFTPDDFVELEEAHQQRRARVQLLEDARRSQLLSSAHAGRHRQWEETEAEKKAARAEWERQERARVAREEKAARLEQQRVAAAREERAARRREALAQSQAVPADAINKV
jgi:hypothetical protein